MTREPAVAGQFYPKDAKSLSLMVDHMISDAEVPALSGRVVGIQVPHAGYPYSGPTAARAFKILAGLDSPSVVMVGPTHRVFLDKAVVYGEGAWKTPLGEVEVDSALAQRVVESDRYFATSLRAHAAEHSLEVQLPFLQRTLHDFRIVPIMVLEPSWEECERMGRAIAEAVRGSNVVLLASTDLYHGESYEDAQRMDSVYATLVTEFNPEGLYRALREGRTQACGGHAVVTVMLACRELGADRAVLLHQTNSNDVTGERGGYCVGYSAVAFVAGEKGNGDEAGTPKPETEGRNRGTGEEDELSEEEQRALLGIARSTVEECVRTCRRQKPKPVTGRLAEPRGVFVTLHKRGELRGCIGYVEAVKPLYLAVSDMAVAASSEDPRFPPVGPDELGDIDIEVTVLSPLRRVSDPDSVIVGKHGLVMRRGGRSGLLLPQVPVEQGWDRMEFLEHTCRKAGLAPGAWKDKGTELFVFTGQVFGEKQQSRTRG